MKKIGILCTALLLCISMVSATGFSAIKGATVTGDYKWISPGNWAVGNWETATYSFSATSPLATVGNYVETEKLGTPWKYALDMNLGANNAGNAVSNFGATTVNDPASSTDITGGYTKYGFHSASVGVFTSSGLIVVGEGAVTVGVKTNFDSAFTQLNQVRVNEPIV